jgi:hypothetical protein
MVTVTKRDHVTKAPSYVREVPQEPPRSIMVTVTKRDHVIKAPSYVREVPQEPPRTMTVTVTSDTEPVYNNLPVKPKRKLGSKRVKAR